MFEIDRCITEFDKVTSASTTLPAALGGTNIGPGLLPANVGADPRLFGVGVMHNF